MAPRAKPKTGKRRKAGAGTRASGRKAPIKRSAPKKRRRRAT